MVFCVNYESGQTWLVDGNLANIIGQRAQITGILGGGLPYLIAMESLLLVFAIAMVIGYGTAKVSDDDFEWALPLIIWDESSCALCQPSWLGQHVQRPASGW